MWGAIGDDGAHIVHGRLFAEAKVVHNRMFWNNRLKNDNVIFMCTEPFFSNK